MTRTVQQLFDLTGKTALVTGGSGVGRGVVGGGVGASESTSATTGALDQVGSALGTSFVLGATLTLGAAVVTSGFVEFVSGQLVSKSKIGKPPVVQKCILSKITTCRL